MVNQGTKWPCSIAFCMFTRGYGLLVTLRNGQAQADVLHQDRRGKRVVQHAVHSAARQLLQRAALQGGD